MRLETLRPISVDTEFIPSDDGNQVVVCVVAKDLRTGEVFRRFADELGAMPFYPHGHDTCLVAYFAAAEIDSYRALGWQLPENIIDLYAEHMRATNGLSISDTNGVAPPARGGLLAALRCHGLNARANESKRATISRILAGPPYDSAVRSEILDYCQQDVEDAEALFRALLPKMEPGWLKAALIRGQYSVSLADFSRNGYPVNADLHDQIITSWGDIRAGMIASTAQFGVYQNSRFNHGALERLILSQGLELEWPTTPSGARSTTEETWREMGVRHPSLAPLSNAQIALVQMKKVQPLAIGPDGRVRMGKRELSYKRLGLPYNDTDLRSTGWGAFRSKTGRNQPMAREFLMLRNAWWRVLLTPPPGKALLYLDWSSQEIAIAAYLSGDPSMIQHYRSGDFYMSFGRAAGLVPPDAHKEDYAGFRNTVLKPVSLGTLYGQQRDSMAARINRPVEEAAKLLKAHADAYSVFWQWTRDNIAEASLTGRIETPLGWAMRVGDLRQSVFEGGTYSTEGVRETTLQNWKMQATGADILRVACIAMSTAGLRIAFPLHDAVLVECDVADVADVSALATRLMEEAAAAVLGELIPVDVDVVLPGQSLLSPKNDKAVAMWGIVEAALQKKRHAA